MKLNDYFRLGRISLKSRKKTTRQTVRGLSFGAILLLPVIFLGLSFYIDINSQVDKDPEIRTFSIPVTQEKFTQKYVSGLYQGFTPELIKQSSLNKYYQTRTFYIDDIVDGVSSSKISKTSVSIGEKTVELPLDITERSSSGKSLKAIQFIETNDTCYEDVFFNFDKNYSSKPLSAGEGFSKQSSKGEILISNRFLTEEYGSFKESDLVGKKISVISAMNGCSSYVPTSRTKGSTPSSEDTKYFNDLVNNATPYTVFKDYTIKGVFDEKIFLSSVRYTSLGASYDSKTKSISIPPLFILTNDSLYNDEGVSFLPEIDLISSSTPETSSIYVYYNQNVEDAQQKALDANLVYFPIGLGASCERIIRRIPNSYAKDSYLLTNFKSYNDASKIEPILSEYFKQSTTSTEDPIVNVTYASTTYTIYSTIYRVFLYVILVLAIFGGIIFFATCLNLYNTIHYSVVSRTNYLGMLRAIGMRDKDVRKQYFVENSILFGRTLIWTTVIGGGICVGIKFALDAIIKASKIDIVGTFGLSLKLNLVYLPLSLLAVFILFIVIDVLCSFIACKHVSTAPLLDLLVEDK